MARNAPGRCRAKRVTSSTTLLGSRSSNHDATVLVRSAACFTKTPGGVREHGGRRRG